METREIGRLEELHQHALLLCSHLLSCAHAQKATVVALHGDLGAGKTTLVQHLAACLGVKEGVTSPTFVVMKRYHLDDDVQTAYDTLVHIDAYRIEEIEEMQPLRFSDMLSEGNTLICIEWAERIAALLPEDTLHITLSLDGENRTLTY